LFRTVRDQFLCDRFKTLTQINNPFKLWISSYHEPIHSSLSCPPLKNPVVKLTNQAYEKGVKLTKKAMRKIEEVIERVQSIEKWAVDIPYY